MNWVQAIKPPSLDRNKVSHYTAWNVVLISANGEAETALLLPHAVFGTQIATGQNSLLRFIKRYRTILLPEVDAAFFSHQLVNGELAILQVVD